MQKSEDRNDLHLKFLLLKITNKIAKMGKEMRKIFDLMDINKNGFCK